MNFNATLLPAGLQDVLPPDAERETDCINNLLAGFSSFGYQHVKPPLAEFEEGLVATGPGQAMSHQMLRLMDPASHRTMSIRADITPQIARIAETRLKDAPRPLRLSYAADVLRVKGSQLHPARQFTQVGCELIGENALDSDIEIIVAAAKTLNAMGIEDLSIDISYPELVEQVLDSDDADGAARRAILSAVDRRNLKELEEIGTPAALTIRVLAKANGAADKALERLRKISVPPEALAAVERIETLSEILPSIFSAAELPVTLTIDPVERKGYDYKTGLAFSLFSKSTAGELGRGGRYDIGKETAIGVTLYMDSVMKAVPAQTKTNYLLVGSGLDWDEMLSLQNDGYRTVRSFVDECDLAMEAKRLGCNGYYLDGVITPLS